MNLLKAHLCRNGETDWQWMRLLFSRMKRGVQRSLAVCLLAVAAVCALAYLYWHEPAEGGFYPKCLFHSLTGLWCPGCGLTRGLYACLHGDYLAAARMNLLLFVVVPVLAACACATRRVGVLKAVDNLLLMSCLLFWILRNSPCLPFVLLAPP